MEMKDEKAFQISDVSYRLRDTLGVNRSIDGMGAPLLQV
jgi:hypothetical protein